MGFAVWRVVEGPSPKFEWKAVDGLGSCGLLCRGLSTTSSSSRQRSVKHFPFVEGLVASFASCLFRAYAKGVRDMRMITSPFEMFLPMTVGARSLCS